MSLPLSSLENLTLGSTPLQATESDPSTSIVDLPTELLKYIASILPPASAATLSLSCRQVGNALGTKYIEKFIFGNVNSIQGRLERFEILQVISRDVESSIACAHCQILHKVTLEPADVSAPTGRRCETVESSLHVWYYLHPGFRLTNIQMAMKLHKTGKDPKPYLDSMFRTVRQHHDAKDHVTYLTHKTKICNDNAIFRSQVWTLLAASHLAGSDPSSKLDGFVNSGFKLCPHLLGQGTQELRKVFLCHCKHLLNGSRRCWNCMMIRKCGRCNIEFHVGSKVFGNKGFAVVVTRWSNMGQVRDTTDARILALLHGNGSQVDPVGTIVAGTMRDYEAVGGPLESFVPTLTPEQEDAFLLPRSEW